MFDPAVQQDSFVEIDHEIISWPFSAYHCLNRAVVSY